MILNGKSHRGQHFLILIDMVAGGCQHFPGDRCICAGKKGFSSGGFHKAASGGKAYVGSRIYIAEHSDRAENLIFA